MKNEEAARRQNKRSMNGGRGDCARERNGGAASLAGLSNGKDAVGKANVALWRRSHCGLHAAAQERNRGGKSPTESWQIGDHHWGFWRIKPQDSGVIWPAVLL